MLNKPVLALCSNRTRLATTNQISGGPEEWLSSTVLKKLGLKLISFDFFVDWACKRVLSELWIKRIVDTSYDPWPQLNELILWEALVQCDGTDYLKNITSFAHLFGFTVHYTLFKDEKWEKGSKCEILDVLVTLNGVENVERLSLPSLMSRIKMYSGGPVKVGSKGLHYATSALECYLSRTDAAWPGDVDALILDSNDRPRFILEYKKHNLTSSVEEQGFEKIYPNPDYRKYYRLALLRDRIGEEIPIIIIFYPTRPNEKKVKIERVGGKANKLYKETWKVVDLPNRNNITACTNFLQHLIKLASMKI